jgi:hypothetical protein
MALIKCPQCGQTVLSVASKCPKCSYLLLQAPALQGSNRELTRCRRCEKTIPRSVSICEYCGYPQLARRRVRFTMGVLLLVAVAVAAVAGIRHFTKPTAPPPVNVESPSPTIQSTIPDTAATLSIPVAPPVEARAQPETPQAVPETTPLPSDAQMRWTRNWANVREGPGTSFPVVGVLQPGTEVAVSGLRRGWWQVHLNGNPQGYVAGDLLVAEPPTR